MCGIQKANEEFRMFEVAENKIKKHTKPIKHKHSTHKKKLYQ